MCPLYVSGLIGPGDRKSVQPMAKRLALGACDQLHHFIAAGVWDATPVETELLVQADRLVGGSDAVLVIDDTAIPKKGTHSVGVAPQYATVLGKTANCQTLVSLTRARGEVPVVLALRLFRVVGIPRHLKVYPADVRMIWPVAKRGRPRQRHVPDILSIPAEDMLANAKWRTISWRTGTKGKLELGLDHFEGRSWQGLHRHALMTMIAYAFLQHRRLATARREKKNQRAAAPADSASRAPRHPRTRRSTTAAAMPTLPKMDLQRAAA